LLADRGAEAGDDAFRAVRAKFSMASMVFSSTPVSAPFQPAWAAPMTRLSGIGKQDRAAIGGQHAKRDARGARHQRIASGRAPS
jgi:hypothetical protein